MAVTVATLIAACPAPVADATGISNGMQWLADCNVFALESTRADLCNKDAIANNSEIYLMNIPTPGTTPTTDELYNCNDKLLHIKMLLMGWQYNHTP